MRVSHAGNTTARKRQHGVLVHSCSSKEYWNPLHERIEISWPSCAHPQDRTGYRLEVATVRKLETESDAFAFGDKLIEKWYGTVEKGSDKGILLVVTTNKDGALTGGPKFLKVTFPSRRSQGQAVLLARPGPSIEGMPEGLEVQPWLQSSHAHTRAVSIFMEAVGTPMG